MRVKYFSLALYLSFALLFGCTGPSSTPTMVALSPTPSLSSPSDTEGITTFPPLPSPSSSDTGRVATRSPSLTATSTLSSVPTQPVAFPLSLPLPSGRIIFNRAFNPGTMDNWEVFLIDLNTEEKPCPLSGTVQAEATAWAIYEPAMPLNLVNLTDDPADDAVPRWLPDSGAISFASNRRGELTVDLETGEERFRFQPYLMQPDGSGITFLKALESAGSISAWSPDGRQVAYTTWTAEALAVGEAGVWIANRDGSRQEFLTFGYSSRWSPTGEWLAVLVWPYGSGDQTDSEVYLIHPDGSDRHLLLKSEAPIREFVWSPDGKTLALSAGDILITSITTGEIRTLELPFVVRCSGWSPDGKWLVCDDQDSIYAISVESFWIIRLVPSERGVFNQYPDWGK